MSPFVFSRNVRLGVAIAVIAIGGTATVHYLHGPGVNHDHGQNTGAATIKLNAGKKWDTDTPLRLGMERIRVLVDSFRLGSTPDKRQAFASAIREQVDYLIQNCKLPPDADEALHVLIGQLLEGANAATQKDDPAAGLNLVRNVLETYPTYFDHPGWPQPQVSPS